MDIPPSVTPRTTDGNDSDDDAPEDVTEWLQKVKRPWSPRRRLSIDFSSQFNPKLEHSASFNKLNGDRLRGDSSNSLERSIPGDTPKASGESAVQVDPSSIFDDDSNMLTYAKTRRSDLMMAAHEAADKRLKQARNPIAEFQECFELIDIDKSGTIDVQELKFAFEVLGQTNVTMAQCQRFINEWDKDSSGSIDFEEFVEVMATNGMMGHDSEVHGVPIDMRLAELRRKQLLREVMESYSGDPLERANKARDTNLSHLVTQPGEVPPPPDADEGSNAGDKGRRNLGTLDSIEEARAAAQAMYGPQGGAARQQARKEREASRLERELVRRSTSGYSGSTRGGVAAREAAKQAVQKIVMGTITRETVTRRKNISRRIAELERARGLLPALESSLGGSALLDGLEGNVMKSMLIAARATPSPLPLEDGWGGGVLPPLAEAEEGTRAELALARAEMRGGGGGGGGADASPWDGSRKGSGRREAEEEVGEIDVFLEGAAVDWPNAQLLPRRDGSKPPVLPKYLIKRAESSMDYHDYKRQGMLKSRSRSRRRTEEGGRRSRSPAGSPERGRASMLPPRPISNMGVHRAPAAEASSGSLGPLDSYHSESSLFSTGGRTEWGRLPSSVSEVRLRQEAYYKGLRSRKALPLQAVGREGHRALGPRPYATQNGYSFGK